MDILQAEGLKVTFQYMGRPDRSSPATGSVYRHKVEQAELVQNCLKV
jgi:2-oxoglutarate dehydrogenase E1 component